jgi:hypothetical protein
MEFSRHAYAVLGIGLVLTAVSLSNSTARKVAVTDKVDPVFVTNGASNPIPIQGGVTVNSIPAVQVSSLPAVQLGADNQIKVSNDASSPVPVSNAREASRVPMTLHNAGNIPENTVGSSTSQIYTVPAGKRLIIQSVFLSGSTHQGQLLLAGQLEMGSNLIIDVPIVMTNEGVLGDRAYFGGVVQGPFYVQAGDSVWIDLDRQGLSGVAFFESGFSGYIEDAS